MKITGVFYHEICGKEAFKSLAISVEEGFEILRKEDLFSYPNVILFESIPIKEEWIARVHSKNWLDYVKSTQYWRCSLYSIGGLWQATEKVLSNEIDNGLVYVGVDGHHAHLDNAWGGCYFNIMAIAINLAREKLKVKRFAIVDTDTHHADGTRYIFKDDEDILHICFCGGHPWDYDFGSKLEGKTKFCFSHGVKRGLSFQERITRSNPHFLMDFEGCWLQPEIFTLLIFIECFITFPEFVKCPKGIWAKVRQHLSHKLYVIRRGYFFFPFPFSFFRWITSLVFRSFLVASRNLFVYLNG